MFLRVFGRAERDLGSFRACLRVVRGEDDDDEGISIEIAPK
jgi:hypothetical protein